MRAQLCTRIGPIEEGVMSYTTVPEPELEPNKVLIKVKACGVCHSNLHMVEGEFKVFGVPGKLPIIPGHEITGVIEQVGKDTKDVYVGQRVGVQVLYQSCRRCDYCLTGNENLCVNKQVTGETVDGGYAEYIAAPFDFIYSLPDNIGFEEGAPLFCPGVTAYRAVRRANVRMGQRVIVIGVGGVGHMSLQFAKLAGAETIAVDRFEGQLKLAEDLGADKAVLADEIKEYVAKNGKADVVMVHAPSQAAVDQAIELVKRGGTILMAVLGSTKILFPQEYSVVSSVIGSRHDMNETLKIASMGKVRVRYTRYGLSEVDEVFKRLKRGQIVGRAVLVP
ncbi:MAG: alcohol dehydrogenase catalytic domain-containing protein [Nitrososphaeria archaeon]